MLLGSSDFSCWYGYGISGTAVAMAVRVGRYCGKSAKFLVDM
jgi:hypothetical protein